MAEIRWAMGVFGAGRVLATTAHVVLSPEPTFSGLGYWVHCDFGDERDEAEAAEIRRTNPGILVPMMGGQGRVTIRDASGTVEIMGDVRGLAPVFRQIAEAFDARLAELPD